MQCSSNSPECPGKKWLFYGSSLGFLAGAGVTYGGSIGVFDAKCLSSGKTCTFIVACARLFGAGISASWSGMLGFALNAPCADDIGGASFGAEADVYKAIGGTVSGTISPGRTLQLGGAFGVGLGASASFQVCNAQKVFCR